MNFEIEEEKINVLDIKYNLPNNRTLHIINNAGDNSCRIVYHVNRKVIRTRIQLFRCDYAFIKHNCKIIHVIIKYCIKH